MLAMSMGHDEMRRGQAELDAVIGRDRMPTFADQPNLSYVNAIAKEVMRWQTVAAQGTCTVFVL